MGVWRRRRWQVVIFLLAGQVFGADVTSAHGLVTDKSRTAGRPLLSALRLHGSTIHIVPPTPTPARHELFLPPETVSPPCPTGFVAPTVDQFLNRYYDGTQTNNTCNYTIQQRTFSSDTTLNAFEDFDMEGGVVVGAGATLTVAAGISLVMGYSTDGVSYNCGAILVDGTLSVASGATVAGDCKTAPDSANIDVANGGTLTSTGGAFTSFTSTTPGSWLGIGFDGGSTGSLQNVTVSYGGGGWSLCGSPAAEIVICNGATVSITGTANTVRGSAANGIEVTGGMPSLQKISFDGIASGYYPLKFDTGPSDLSAVSSLSDTTDNNPYMYLGGGTVTGTWDFSTMGLAPYIAGNVTIMPGAQITLGLAVGSGGTFYWPDILGIITTDAAGSFTAAGSLTIPDDMNVFFSSGGGIDDYGALKAGGSSGDVLVALNPSPSWMGIQVESGGVLSFNTVTLYYAGHTWSCGTAALVICDATLPTNLGVSSVHFATGIIGDSVFNGIEVEHGTPDLQSINFTSGKATNSYPLKYDTLPATLSNVINLHASNNSDNHMYVGGGTTTNSLDFSKVGLSPYFPNGFITSNGFTVTLSMGSNTPTLPIQINGLIAVQTGGTLDIAPGTQAVLDNPGGFDIYGDLNAIGTLASPEAFSSGNGIHWSGVIAENGSTVTITAATIDNAESTAICGITAALDDCGGSMSLHDDTFLHNPDDDVAAAFPHTFSIDSSWLGRPTSGDGIDDVGWATGQPKILAVGNWWDSKTGPTIASNPGGTGTPVSPGVDYSNVLAGPPFAATPLNLGFNFVGIPSTGDATAMGLISDIQSQNPGVTVKAIDAYQNGRYQDFVPGFSPNFSLSPGKGIVAFLSGVPSTGAAWLPSGTPLGSATIALSPGWNLFDVPAMSAPSAAATDAQTLWGELTVASTEPLDLAEWDPTQDSYDIYNGSGTNFRIVRGVAVWAYVSKPGDVTFSSP